MTANPHAFRVSLLAARDMRVRTVTGFPVLRGALAFARDFVLDDDAFVAAHVYDGERLVTTVSAFDEIVDDWFAFAAAVRTEPHAPIAPTEAVDERPLSVLTMLSKLATWRRKESPGFAGAFGGIA
jgi:hypothetical protein